MEPNTQEHKFPRPGLAFFITLVNSTQFYDGIQDWVICRWNSFDNYTNVSDLVSARKVLLYLDYKSSEQDDYIRAWPILEAKAKGVKISACSALNSLEVCSKVHTKEGTKFQAYRCQVLLVHWTGDLKRSAKARKIVVKLPWWEIAGRLVMKSAWIVLHHTARPPSLNHPHSFGDAKTQPTFFLMGKSVGLSKQPLLHFPSAAIIC